MNKMRLDTGYAAAHNDRHRMNMLRPNAWRRFPPAPRNFPAPTGTICSPAKAEDGDGTSQPETKTPPGDVLYRSGGLCPVLFTLTIPDGGT